MCIAAIGQSFNSGASMDRKEPMTSCDFSQVDQYSIEVERLNMLKHIDTADEFSFFWLTVFWKRRIVRKIAKFSQTEFF